MIQKEKHKEVSTATTGPADAGSILGIMYCNSPNFDHLFNLASVFHKCEAHILSEVFKR